MEKVLQYYFSLIASLRKQRPMGDGSSGQKNSSDLRGRVFLEEISLYRSYSNKEYQKEHHSIKLRTWNVWILNQGGKVENLKKEMQKAAVSVLGVNEAWWKGMVKNRSTQLSVVVITQCIIPG